MGFISFLIFAVISGLLVGALGRLAIPGPNPMSIGTTILVGVAGSFLGGLVGYLIFRRPGGLLFAVAGAALLVWLMQRHGIGTTRRDQTTTRRF